MNATDRVDAARRRSPASVELARCLSLASRISSPLLRRFRLRFLHRVDPGVEAELWLSPLVEIRGARSILLYPQVAAHLRLELAETPRKLEDAHQLLRRTQHTRPPLVRLEEELTWWGLGYVRSGDAQEVTAKLRSMIKAIAEQDRRGLGR